MFRSTPQSFGKRQPGSALKLSAALLLLCAWLLAWGVASAQEWPPLEGGVVSDATGRLDAPEVYGAASELQQLNVKPLAVLRQNRRPYSSMEQLEGAAIAQYDLGSADQPDADLFAIVVVLDERQSTFVYGDRLRPIMEQRRGDGTLADQLRINYLTPNLAAGDFTEAYVQTFRQAAREINLYRNPPATATPQPPVVTNIDTAGIGRALLWIMGVVVALIVLAVAGPVLWRGWRRNQEAAARRRALQAQLVQARNVAADMITDLDFPHDPRGQIQYRFLALNLERERPDELARITEEYGQMYNRLAEALALFNSLNQAKPTTEEQMQAAIAQYQQVQATVKEAQDFLGHLAERSREVERQVAAAPGETDAAKKAIAAANDELARLAAAASDLYAVQPATLLQPAQQKLADAEQWLNAQPPMPLHAYEAALACRALADAALSSISALSAAYEELAGQRARLLDARSKGFKLSASNDDMARSVRLLSEAARSLESGDEASFTRLLEEGTEAIRLARQRIDDTVTLQASNQEALARLEAEGEAVREYIEQGARAFDKVDEYAESSWEDIRGNGTEAQLAADYAFELWQEASALNALSPDSPQDFATAREEVEKANKALRSARKLVSAIIDRLKHIEESARVAHQEIATAEHDLQAGEAFVSKYDPDISPQPADMLTEAAQLLGEARSEAAQEKPDWIRVVAVARQANDLADRALSDARSEREAMQARRQRINTLSHQADTSLSRASNFASVHRADVDPSVFAALVAAQESIQRADNLIAQADQGGLEDVSLAQALDEAATHFQAALQAADKAYEQASAQFAAMEQLRREAFEAVQRADATIQSAATYIRGNGGVVKSENRRLLEAAIDKLPSLGAGASASALRDAIKAAKEAEELARRAYSGAVRNAEADERRRQQEVIDTMLAVGIGALLSGGEGGRRSSGRGGWGGGGSSGWGGGGRSSGSWGGGGRSSGSFGGGGRSSGSWGGGGRSSGGW